MAAWKKNTAKSSEKVKVYSDHCVGGAVDPSATTRYDDHAVQPACSVHSLVGPDPVRYDLMWR